MKIINKIISALLSLAIIFLIFYCIIGYYNFILIFKPTTKSTNEIYNKNLDKYANLNNWFQNTKYKETSIFSNNTKLYGKIINNKNSNKYVILLHDYRSDYKRVLSEAEKYYNNGFSILMPDSRYFGDSQGNFSTLGYLERNDLQEWIKYIVKTSVPNTKIIIHGIEMGATSVLLNSNFPPNVVGLILDSPYESPYKYIEEIYNNYVNIPEFLGLRSLYLISDLYIDHSIKNTSFENTIPSNLPTLFINCNSNKTTENIFQSFKKINSKSTLINFNDKDDLYDISHTEEYFKPIFKFINDYNLFE